MIPLLLLLTACAGDPATVPAAAAAVATPLTLASLEAVQWRPTEELTGSLEPIAAVQLGFDVPGRLEALLAPRGTTVRRGDAVARLDASMAEAQLAQAEAALAGALAQLSAGEAGFSRMQKLRDAGAVADQQYTDAEGAVLAGRAGARQGEAAVRLARTNVAFHVLRAPIDGIVTNAPDNAGMLVGAGTPMFMIEDLSALQMKATAPESAGWIAAGQQAVVMLASGEVAPATVERVIPALDPATRRIPVEVRIASPPPGLRSHAFARVRITGSVDVPAWAVPSGAVVARPDFCMFLSEGAAVRRVPVVVLSDSDGRAIVQAAGVAAGAQVIVNPAPGTGG